MEDMAATLRRFAEMTDDDLYLEIGRHLYGRPAFPVPPSELIELAKRWSQQTLPRVVCDNPQLKAIASQQVSTQELITLVCAVLAAATHTLGTVPAVTAAALVVRVGLRKFCAPFWNTEHTGRTGPKQA